MLHKKSFTKIVTAPHTKCVRDFFRCRPQSLQKDDFQSKSSLRDNAGVGFDVNGYSTKIYMEMFEEPINLSL